MPAAGAAVVANMGVEGEAKDIAAAAAAAELRVGDVAGSARGVAPVVEAVVGHTGAQVGAQIGHGGVVGVEQHMRLWRQFGQGGAPGRRDRIHLAVAVELVAEQVVDHHEAWAQLGEGLRHSGLVGLEQADRGARAAAPVGVLHGGGGEAGDQVGAGAVMQHALATGRQDLREHAARGRLAVGAGDQDGAVGQGRAQLAQHVGGEPPRHAAWHSGAAAQAQPPREPADNFARCHGQWGKWGHGRIIPAIA